MKIVFDSNIIISNYFMDSTNFQVFFESMGTTGDSILVPKIVVDEVLNKYLEEIRSFASKTNQMFSRLRPFLENVIESPLQEGQVDTVVSNYKTWFEKRLSELNTTIAPYPSGISHEQLVERALKRQKPFKADGRGYRDTLIWRTILDLATPNSEPPVAFVTDNRKDFADKDGNLHPDLLKEMGVEGIEANKIQLFLGLTNFVEHHIKPSLENLEEIRMQIESGQYPDLNLKEWLEQDLYTVITHRPVSLERMPFPIEFESPVIASEQGVDKIVSVKNVRRLPKGELLIDADVDVYLEFDFFIYKSDYWAMEEREGLWVSDPDWNDHYVSASETDLARISVQLIFDPELEEVTSGELLDVWSEDPIY